jgi:hypothetical protein
LGDDPPYGCETLDEINARGGHADLRGIAITRISNKPVEPMATFVLSQMGKALNA